MPDAPIIPIATRFDDVLIARRPFAWWVNLRDECVVILCAGSEHFGDVRIVISHWQRVAKICVDEYEHAISGDALTDLLAFTMEIPDNDDLVCAVVGRLTKEFSDAEDEAIKRLAQMP